MHLTILVPAHTTAFNKRIKAVAEKFKSPDTVIDVVDIVNGTTYIEGRWDIAVNTPYVISAALEAEKKGTDGIFVTDFDYCGVEAAREVVNVPIIGANRASSFTAMMLAEKFSIVTITDSVVAMQESHTRLWGIHENLASIRPTGLSVDDLLDTPKVIKAVYEEAVKAIEQDGAQAIILGCTGMVGISEPVMEMLKRAGKAIPVMDPNGTAVNYLELLMRQKLMQSRLTYYYPDNFDPNLLPDSGTGMAAKTPVLRQITRQNLEDLNNGAAFFASGGGGSVFLVREIIDKIMELDKPMTLIDYKDVPASGMMAVSAIIGAPDAEKEDQERFVYAIPRAFKLLEETTDVKLDYVIPVETGSISSVVPFILSAKTGIPVVDADGAGRSIPALSETTFAAGGVSASPTTLANDVPEEEKAVKAVLFDNGVGGIDELARNVISADDFNQCAGLADYIMNGDTMRSTAVLGTVTLATKLGEELREARAHGSFDPFELIQNFIKPLGRKAYLLGRGKVTEIKTETTGGFDLNTVTIEEANGNKLYINSQNENLIAWSAGNDSPLVIAPDLISYVTPDGQPLSNADIKKGDELLLIGSEAPEKMKQAQIIDTFLETLKGMGYYGNYVPIAQLQAEK